MTNVGPIPYEIEASASDFAEALRKVGMQAKLASERMAAAFAKTLEQSSGRLSETLKDIDGPWRERMADVLADASAMAERTRKAFSDLSFQNSGAEASFFRLIERTSMSVDATYKRAQRG